MYVCINIQISISISVSKYLRLECLKFGVGGRGVHVCIDIQTSINVSKYPSIQVSVSVYSMYWQYLSTLGLSLWMDASTYSPKRSVSNGLQCETTRGCRIDSRMKLYVHGRWVGVWLGSRARLLSP